MCVIWQGPTGTVAAARKMIGETNPLESLPGSIRGRLRRRGWQKYYPRVCVCVCERVCQLMVCGRERVCGLANDEQRLDSRIIIII